jgi:hypothetical protein
MTYLIDEVSFDLSKKGFAKIKNFFTDEEKKDMLNLSKIMIENSCNNKDSTQLLVPNEFFQNTLVIKKLNDKYFIEFITRIINMQFNENLSNDTVKKKIKIGINVLSKSNHKTPFHFDNTYLNIVIPLNIFRPIIKDDGALHIYPNIRSASMPMYFNKIVTLILKFKFIRFFLKNSIINYEFGDAYLFNGYKSFHGVPLFKGKYSRVVVNCAVRM